MAQGNRALRTGETLAAIGEYEAAISLLPTAGGVAPLHTNLATALMAAVGLPPHRTAPRRAACAPHSAQLLV